MHPLRTRFVDHVLFVGLALEISCTAVAIVDSLHDKDKNEAKCMAALLIAWKFHSNSHDHTLKVFARIAVPTRGTFCVGNAQLRKSELLVLKELNWTVPAITIATAIPDVKPIYRQFVSRAIHHSLRYVNQRTSNDCVAWAVVHYACYISGSFLQHTDFDMAPCSCEVTMIRVFHVLFKNNANLWNECG